MADLQDHEANQEVLFTSMEYFFLKKILGFIYSGINALMIRHEKRGVIFCLDLGVSQIILLIIFFYCLHYHLWQTNPFMFSSCFCCHDTCAINTFFHTHLQWGNYYPLTDGELRSKGAERSFNTTMLSTGTTKKVTCFPRPEHVWGWNPSAHSGLATTKSWAWGRPEPCPRCGI